MTERFLGTMVRKTLVHLMTDVWTVYKEDRHMKVLVCDDEPLFAEGLKQNMLGFKKQGKTILLASHSAKGISFLCDTVHENGRRGLMEGRKRSEKRQRK